MRIHRLFLFILLLVAIGAGAQDTLYFKLSNPWNTVKAPDGKYLRKCVKEDYYYHVWDYKNATLVTESFYSDTNFTHKLFCHKYYDESTGLLDQSRCYESGRLHGYFVGYGANGDTTSYDVYENGELVRSWTNEPIDKIFAKSEFSAEFPGGESAWDTFLVQNINRPDSLKHIKGKVIIEFVINKKGEVVSTRIVQSVHSELDKETARVIRSSRRWKPARQNGRFVHSFRTQPVTFE